MEPGFSALNVTREKRLLLEKGKSFSDLHTLNTPSWRQNQDLLISVYSVKILSKYEVYRDALEILLSSPSLGLHAPWLHLIVPS